MNKKQTLVMLETKIKSMIETEEHKEAFDSEGNGLIDYATAYALLSSAWAKSGFSTDRILITVNNLKLPL